MSISDGSGLGLSPKPARPRRFLGGPSPPEARSSKPESPAGFFGPKIGRFSAQFGQKIGHFWGIFLFKFGLWPRLKCGRILAGILTEIPAEHWTKKRKKYFEKNIWPFFPVIQVDFILQKSPNKARSPIQKSPARPRPDT